MGYLSVHNIGLCMYPDIMQVGLQTIFIKVFHCSRAQYEQEMSLAAEYGLKNFSKYRILTGPCKKKSIRGIVCRFEGGTDKQKQPALPRVRRGTKHNVVNAMRFMRVLMHTALVKHNPHAAKAWLRVMEFARYVNYPTGLVTSEIGAMRSCVAELLPLAQTAALIDERRIKDFNLSDNWGKARYAADLLQWLGSTHGAGSDEHGERLQKLMHVAYRCFSNKYDALTPSSY